MKLKLNWGASIVMAFAAFIAFILFFVIKVQGNRKYDNELVVEEYYKHDARFGEEYAKLENAQQLAQKPLVETSPDGVRVTFPKDFDPAAIDGKVSFYRPSNQKLDFSEPLELSTQTIIIPNDNLVGGRWDMTLYWTYQGKEYLLKKSLYL